MTNDYHAGHLLETADGHYTSGRYEEAIAVYTAALRELPDDASVYCNRAECHLRLANYRQAVEDFEKAADLDTDEALGRFETALSLDDWHPFRSIYFGYASIDPYFWIIDYLQQSLFVFDPGSIKTHVQLGDAYRWLQEDSWMWNQFDEDSDENSPERYYDEALTIPPIDATDHYYKGKAYSRKGDSENAFACYSSAIELDVDYAPAYCDRAMLYIDKGDYEHADADLSESIRIDPNNGIYRYHRGMARMDHGDSDGARSDLSNALVLGYTSGKLQDALDKLSN